MKKLSLTQRILQNNYVLLIIAVVISLGIWIYMSMNSSSDNSDTTVTLNDVPIQIEISDSAKKLGLQVFLNNDAKANVTVSGMRTMLGQITEADLVVTAATNSISTTGNHNLPVSATKANPSSNFQITSCTPSSIDVVVDYLKESEFDIQDEISYTVKDDYYGSFSFSHKKVSISGPQTEVLKIKKVAAKAEVKGELTENKDIKAEIVLYDEGGNVLPKDLLKLSSNTVDVSIEVSPEKTVKLNPVFKNKPTGLNLTSDMIQIKPSEIMIAGPQAALDNINTVNLEAIDFSKLNNTKVELKDLGIDVPKSCKNITDTSSAVVTLDLRGMTSKQFDVENFTVEGLPSDYNCEVTSKNVTVSVIGPKDEIDSLKAEDIVAAVDASDSKGKAGSVELPVKFKLGKATSCWAFGDYKANVTISKN